MRRVAQAVPVRAIGLAAYDPAGDPSRRGARFGIDMALAVVESAPSALTKLGAGNRTDADTGTNWHGLGRE